MYTKVLNLFLVSCFILSVIANDFLPLLLEYLLEFTLSSCYINVDCKLICRQVAFNFLIFVYVEYKDKLSIANFHCVHICSTYYMYHSVCTRGTEEEKIGVVHHRIFHW